MWTSENSSVITQLNVSVVARLQGKRTCLISSVRWERLTTGLAEFSTNQRPAGQSHWSSTNHRPAWRRRSQCRPMTAHQHTSQAAWTLPRKPWPWRRHLATLVTVATVHQLAHVSWYVICLSHLIYCYYLFIYYFISLILFCIYFFVFYLYLFINLLFIQFLCC